MPRSKPKAPESKAWTVTPELRERLRVELPLLILMTNGRTLAGRQVLEDLKHVLELDIN